MRGRAWTRDEITILQVYSSEERTLQDIARVLNRSYEVVRKKAITLGIETYKREKKEVAVYRGDELLAVGTVKECAEITGYAYQTLLCYLTPSFQKRYKYGKKGPKIQVIEIEDDENDTEE